MERVYNFSAGPSVLPLPVLKQVQQELLNVGGTGMSVMEMSHRSKGFMDIITETEKLLRELMTIPDNYKVLFLQGGASTQFAMVPMNLLRSSMKADYVNTGMWAKKALQEAKGFGTVKVVASSEHATYNYIPQLETASFTPDADYFHITTNNTIFGTRYTALPDTGSVPLVADMSSNILSEANDVSRFGLIYAGAQKNIGPAGLTLVIIREDLIGHAPASTPTMLNYKTHADNDSMFNTPPTFAIYVAMLVFQWLKGLGGLPAIEKINNEKANMLYDFLDNSSMFKGTVVPNDRSLMNIPFLLPTEDLNKQFIKEANAQGFVNLEGHRSVGGMRASIYNPMPIDGVLALVNFMKTFETNNR